MKILLVQETDWFEKGPLQQNHLMERLSSRGHQVCVIDHEILWKSHRDEGWRSKRQVFNHISRIYQGADVMVIRPSIIRTPNLDYISLLFSRRKEIARQLKEFKPDIILGFQILSAYLAARLAKQNNIPFIYYWTDVYHTQIPFKLYQPLGKLIETRNIKMADRVLAINEELRDVTIKMGAEPERAEVVRASVDHKRFSLDSGRSKIRNQYGIRGTDSVFCFVGLFHKHLALDELVLELARKGDSSLKLLLVGEGDQHAPKKLEELSELARKSGVDKQVILTGRKPYQEIPELIAAADICLLPAYNVEMMRDIVPIKMYEYMAMKKPVIATKLPGVMKEFGADNGVTYVTRPEDVIPKAIELIASGSLNELGSKARKFVERYSWDNITDEFEQILEEVINKRQNERISKRV